MFVGLKEFVSRHVGGGKRALGEDLPILEHSNLPVALAEARLARQRRSIDANLDAALERSPNAHAQAHDPCFLAANYLASRVLVGESRAIINAERAILGRAAHGLAEQLEMFRSETVGLFDATPGIRRFVVAHFLEKQTKQLKMALSDVPYTTIRVLRVNGFEADVSVFPSESLDSINADNRHNPMSWEARHEIPPKPVDRVQVKSVQRENGEVIFEIHLNRQPELLQFRAQGKQDSWSFVREALIEQIRAAANDLKGKMVIGVREEGINPDPSWISTRFVVAPIIGSREANRGIPENIEIISNGGREIRPGDPNFKVGLLTDYCQPDELRNLEKKISSRSKAISSWSGARRDKSTRLMLNRIADLRDILWKASEPARESLKQTIKRNFFIPDDQEK